MSRALEHCRDSIGVEMANGAELESLREIVAAFARAARNGKTPPERTLALFKRMVSELPEIQHRRGDERGVIVSQLSEMVINAYFESVVEPRAGP